MTFQALRVSIVSAMLLANAAMVMAQQMRQYTLDISNADVSPDGDVTRSAIVVNGASRGPLLVANKVRTTAGFLPPYLTNSTQGDGFSIDVENHLSDAGLQTETSVVRKDVALLMLFSFFNVIRVYQSTGTVSSNTELLGLTVRLELRNALYPREHHSTTTFSLLTRQVLFGTILISVNTVPASLLIWLIMAKFIKTGVQYCDGLRGPIVVYDPQDPHTDLYDEDNGVLVTSCLL